MKDGSSNGAGRAGKYKHLAMEGSSLSDLESEDELQIDETPPPRRKPAGPSKKKKLSGENLTLNKNIVNVVAIVWTYIYFIALPCQQSQWEISIVVWVLGL